MNKALRTAVTAQMTCFAAAKAGVEPVAVLLVPGGCGAVALTDAPTKLGSISSPSTSTKAIPLY